MGFSTDTPFLDPGPGGSVAMVRLTGELTTKARRTRARFQRALAANIRAALSESAPGAELHEGWSRLFVTVPAGGSLSPLSRVFGVSSFSVLDGFCDAGLDAIVATGTGLYEKVVRGRSYAVRVRRRGEHAFRSADVAVRLGAALNQDARVDLADPDVEIHVEIRGEGAYLFSARSRGAGGLPLGAEGRAVALLSGGFDSAVAAWMMLRRGIHLDYVFCNLAAGAYRRSVLEVAKVLSDRWSYGSRPRIHVVDFRDVVAELRATVPRSLLQIVLKRQMYRAADRVAAQTGGDAIVTGESVGQVSSQTLANLRAMEGVAERPILRPLVGMEKEEIIAASRRIGTYVLSARVREHCAISEGRPSTAARGDMVRAAESGLDPERIGGLVASAESLDLRATDLAEVSADALFVDRIEPGSIGIDMRPEDVRRAVPWPGAIVRSYEELAGGFADLDADRTVVLVCPQGLLSAQIAERMQADGREAYSLRGGDLRLRRLLGERRAEVVKERP